MAECPGCWAVVAVDDRGNLESHSYHGSGRCIGSEENPEILEEYLQRW